VEEPKPAPARPGGGLGIDSDSNDARRPASETDKTAQKTVATPDLTVAYVPISDPLAPTADFKSDDSLADASGGFSTSEEAPIPHSFGRYRVDGVLGRGGFGAVYRAWDDQLQRPVAIKVTYREKLAPALREMFLTEARSVAALDHPSIVPVYDVGQTDSGDYFVVSKLIGGSDLAARLQTDRFTHEQAVDIIRSVALALHHAHSRGLVHRDVKPGNILIDNKGNAFLTDFGLALSENQLGRGASLVGTLLYMSPEQARREGNRVDGRSDVYSLGVVLYQLLTDRTPFRSPEALELLDLIATTDVRPPRQIDDTIPPQVEQVCLKALSRTPAERYSTAKDFADALAESIHPSPPPVKRDRRVMLAAGLAFLATIGLVLLFMFRSGGAADSQGASATDIASLVVPGGTLPADLRVERFEMQVSRNRGPFVPIDQAAPLRSGDHVRFSVELNRAAYAGLVWIDGQGAIEEIFPSDPEAGHRGSEPIRRLKSPQQLDRGWPVVGPGGIETAVLVISDQPLPQDISSMMPFSAGLPRRQVPLARYEASKQLAAISTIDALAVTSGTRALAHETTRVDDPVLNLLEELRKHYDIIHALSIRHDPSSLIPPE